MSRTNLLFPSEKAAYAVLTTASDRKHVGRFEEGTTAYQAFRSLRLRNNTLEGIQAAEAKAKYVTAALEATRQLLQVCKATSHSLCSCFVPLHFQRTRPDLGSANHEACKDLCISIQPFVKRVHCVLNCF